MQFATLLEHSPDAIAVLDPEGRICEWNPAAENLLERARTDVIDMLVREIIPSDYQAQFDALWARLIAGASSSAPSVVWLTRGGVRASVAVHIAAIAADGNFAGAVAILRSAPTPDTEGLSGAHGVGDAALVEGFSGQLVGDGAVESLGVLERDDLTDLPGRRRLQRRLAEPVPPGMQRGVAVLDVDAFAMVNESLGHDAGDLVLAELGRRLRESTDATGLGRWQADLFMWVLDCDDPKAALDALSVQITAALRRPFEVVEGGLHLSVSIGLVTSQVAQERDLVGAAMDALRAAKDAGRDRAVWYDLNLKPSSTRGLRLANDLHRGIENDELRLHYQPIMDLATNDIVGMEALVRWERPGVGLLNPVSFIDIAERTGQIVQLGNWVARHACEAAAGLPAGLEGPRTVSINVSARQLSDPGLVEMLTAALRDSGCPPSALVVEVTETALMYDLAAATATLDTIKELGVGLDLDDFGTGHSSLLYLKHFPVDRIKIDQSFVAGLGSNWADTAIVASTIALAHSIGIQAVAEGVETQGQLDQLRTMGCDFAQGFLLSRPLPLDVLTAWCSERVPPVIAHDRLAEDDDPARLATSVERNVVADQRDDMADARDQVAAGRDLLADQRDAVADGRDQSGDERDAANDARDERADQRADRADAREVRADLRDENRNTITPTGAEHPPSTGKRPPKNPNSADDIHKHHADLHAGAKSSRTRSAHDRTATADDRDQAEHDRGIADRAREAKANQRRQAELGREEDTTSGAPPSE